MSDTALPNPSHAELLRVAAALRLPDRAFIDGDWSASDNGALIETSNPATGAVLSTLAHCGQKDVDRAVAAARWSFRSGAWTRCAPEKRKDALLKLAALIRRDGVRLAVMESLESGKPIRDCLREITVSYTHLRAHET